MQTHGPTLPVRGYAQLPGVWSARDVTRSSPAKGKAERRKSRSSSGLVPFEVDKREGMKRLPPMQSPPPCRRASDILQSFSRSPSPVKCNPLPMAYSQETNANPMASFGALDEDSFVENTPPRPVLAPTDDGLAADGVQDGSWKTQYGVFDLTFAGGPVADVLYEVQGRLKDAWLMGPCMPVLRTAPILKLLKSEHLEILKKACNDTQPLRLQLDHFRARRVRHAHAAMLELDAVFSSAGLSLMKEHWLAMLGDDVDDLEIRLYDRSLSVVHVSLGRVGAEWSDQMAEFVRTVHDEFLLPLEFSVSALHVLEDVSAGSCSILPLHGKAAQWEKETRRPGWMSLLISDALNELDAKPPLEHTFESLRAGSAMSVSGLLDKDGRPLDCSLRPGLRLSTTTESGGRSVEDPVEELGETVGCAEETVKTQEDEAADSDHDSTNANTAQSDTD